VKFTLTADIPDELIRAGTVADVLKIAADDYDKKGDEEGNFFGIRWTLTFEEKDVKP
jgi:hypothetical protein